MAQKRMFDKSIIENDYFMDLPMGSKALYFLLGMEADDEGFVSPKRVLKLYGGSDDDIKVLISKKFIIPFESGVVVITDWKINNWLDKRRIKETRYQLEKATLNIENGRYIQGAKQVLSKCLESIEENSIEENSIEENREEEKSDGFKKPSLTEIENYCSERNNNINANHFYDFYESKGWFIGKNKMKNWQACIRTWEKKSVVKENVPAWFDKEIKSQPLDPEKQKEIEEMLKEYS